MIERIERYFMHTDARGSIEGIINKGIWREINIIHSSANCERGNHYHNEITELFIIIKGEIEVTTQQVKDNRLFGKVFHDIVREGDVFLIPPLTNHVFNIKQESQWINVLSEPISQDNPDILRIQ